MRLTAARLLHALPGAVVITSMVTLAAMPSPAAAATPPPVPFVIAIDAGHGGSPDNNHPDRLFDPGSIAGNGLVEKDLTLDVAKRVQRQLQADQVKVVMTRSSDQYVGIETRMATAAEAGAQQFVSIHFNFFQDPTIGGSVILYPRDSDKQFATLMSAAVAKRLGRFNIASGGTMLRDNLWIHAPMPAVTVEAAYLTNKNEAEQLQKDSVKEAIASGITAGIEAQVPGIPGRKAEILKYREVAAKAAAAHHAAAIAAPVTAPSLPAMPRGIPVLQLGVAMGVLFLLVRYRRQTIPVLAFGVAVGSVAHARLAGGHSSQRTRRGVRRRRSRAPLWNGARTYY